MPRLNKPLKKNWIAPRPAFQRRKHSNTKFYQSKLWRKVRKGFLNKNPLCVICDRNGHTQAAEVVDHILPIRLGGNKLSYNNLQALCHRCHNIKSGKEAHIKV